MRRRDPELRRALGEIRVPDEEAAEERSWELVRAAYAERAPLRPSHRGRRLALALALGVLLIALGLSPAGAKVGDLVSDVVGIGTENAKPTLRSLPAAGELLVSSDEGVWLVRADGSKRLLGDYRDASWSPHGIYVALADGRELVVSERDGDVRWTLPAPGEVRDPRWVGTDVDTRIAYRSGNDLRVVAGDGDPATDNLIARDVAPTAPVWRPAAESKLDPGFGLGPYVLTYVDGAGRVVTVNADTGERLPTLDADRRRLSPPPSGKRERRVLSPDGSRQAILDRAGRQDRLIVRERGGGGRVLFSAPGELTGPTWSPDGRWLLLGWPEADEWLFIHTERPHRVEPFDRITEQFSPGGIRDGGSFPRATGWALPEA